MNFGRNTRKIKVRGRKDREQLNPEKGRENRRKSEKLRKLVVGKKKIHSQLRKRVKKGNGPQRMAFFGCLRVTSKSKKLKLK